MEAYYNPRYQMWCRLIPGYSKLGITARGKAQWALVDAWGYSKNSDFQPQEEDYRMIRSSIINVPCVSSIGDCVKYDTIDCCKTVNPVPTPLAWTLSQQWEALKQARTTREEERNMYAEMKPQAYAAASVQAAANPDADKIKHLSKRLDSAHSKLIRTAETQFGFDDDAPPSSPKELIERIKAGAFVFEEDNHQIKADGSWTVDGEEQWHDSPWHYISWRTKPADKEGFKAFEKTLQAAKQKVEDTIKVLTPAEGLAALQAFESSTIN